MKKKLLFFSFLYAFIYSNYSQQIWHKQTNKKLSSKKVSDHPNDYKSLKLNRNYFLSIVKTAPERKRTNRSSRTISLPVNNRQFEVFEVFEASNFSTKLHQKFPLITSYIAKSTTSDKTARLSYSKYNGLHAYITTNEGTLIVKPINDKTDDYGFFYKKNAVVKSKFECSTIEQAKKNFQNKSYQLNSLNDGYLRKYRVAIAASAEYTNFFLTGSETTVEEKKATVLAAINNSLTRINGIFERDFGVTMELVDNNDQLIFFNANTDPFSTGNYNNQLQVTLDNTIGTDNYDVGHLYVRDTAIYGNAGCIGCVCTEGAKGSAFTAHTDPSSDHFYMIASHEFGHQFGGYHVQSSSSCRSGLNSEVEPGSGSTIMGYAGICSPNVQENPDDYFNYVDIRDVIEWTRNGSSCTELIPTGNNDPTVDAGQDFIIPISTAFILTGNADDIDDNTSLTYCWEQNNPENPTSSNFPQSNWVLGPLFRSKAPTNSPIRYIPQLEDVLNGNLTPTWEVLPSVARTLDFALTVRDNATSGPKTASDLMTVTVVDNGGAFTVTSQKNKTNWNVGQIKTITWDVAGTNQAPINAENVDVLLSLDGGFTFPHTLVSNAPNNGLANIIVPSLPEGTDQGRIMIRPTNNIFYAVNAANIAIRTSEFVMNFPETFKEVCKPNAIEYNFTYKTFLGFNGNTTFSVENLPDNLQATFTPAEARENNTSVKLTITNTSNSAIGEVAFNVIGRSDIIERQSALSFNIYETELTKPILSFPENNSLEITHYSTKLEWNTDENSESYSIEIASDLEFNNILESVKTNLSEYIIDNPLDFNTTYYWRVKGENLCRQSEFSDTFSFTTSCAPIYNVSVINTTTNTTDISWSDSFNTNWEIEVVTSGTIPTGTGVTTATNQYTIDNLTPNTNYDVYIRAQCSSTNYSDWTGPYRFNTLEDFCDLGKFFDSGGENGNYPNNEFKETVIAPVNGGFVEINFESFQLENNQDFLSIYDGNNRFAPFIGSYTGTNSPGIIRSKIGQGITFAFYSNSENNDIGWEASVNCIIPTCPAPQNLTSDNLLGNSVDLSWTAGGSESQWEIEYGLTGFNKGSGTKILTSSNPTTINTLNTSTTYDFYVTAVCGATPNEDDSFATSPLTITTPICGIFTAPYTFNVEDQNTNSIIQNCWSGEPEFFDGTYFWNAQSSMLNENNITGPYKANTGNNYFSTKNYYNNPNDEAILISPIIDISTLTSPTLNFHSFMYGTTIGSLHIDIFNNGVWNEDIFVLNGQQQETITDLWEEHFIDLSAFSNQIQIRFRADTNGFYDNEIAIDDINVYNLPNCIKPSNIEISNITATTVDLSWTANGNGTSWIIEYGNPNFSTGTGTSIIVNTNNFTLDNLPANSEVEIYIKSICGNNPGDDDSDNVGPIKITTPCDAFTAPYSFDVENQNIDSVIENCWTGQPEVYQAGYYWEAKSSKLYETSTGPYKANKGNRYFSTGDSGFSGSNVANLLTPVIDISSLTTPTLNFHSFLYGEFIGGLHVDIFNNGIWDEDVFVLNGQQQESSTDFWKEHFIDLSSYTGEIQIRFRANTNGNYNNEIAIDDINVYNLPNCITPSDVAFTNVTDTTVDLSWTANGNGTSWIVEYGDTGFTVGNGTSITVNSNNYTLENLPSNTEIDIYIKSTCGNNPGEDDSDFIGPLKIKTLCGTFIAPYNFDVEEQNTGTLSENCWTGEPEVYQDGYYWQANSSSFYQGSTGPYKANKGNKYFRTVDNGSTTNDEASLLTPVIDISSLTTPTLNFHSFMYGEFVGSLHIDIFNNGTWNDDIFVINGQQQQSSRDFWEEHFINLSAYTGEIQVRFRAIANGDYNNEIALDDVNIYNLPSCIKPSDVTYNNVTATTVDLSWTANGNDTSWIVEYGTSNFTPGTGTSVIANSNHFTLTNIPSNSDIDIYISSTCGSNPGDNDSDAIGPIQITTPCDVFIAPYSFDVENHASNFITDYCWSAFPETYVGDYYWESKSSKRYTANTGPFKAYEGNRYFSTIDAYRNTDNEANLTSPTIDISSLTTPTLNFHSFMHGDNVGNLHVDIFNNGTWNEDIFVINGQQQTSSNDFWDEHFIDLSGFSGEIQIRFRASSSGNYNNEIAIDAINVFNLPNCIKPSDITYSNVTATTVDLSWTANGSGTTWIVEYGTTNFTPGTGTSVIADNPNFTLENLPSNSEIDIYIKSSCGNNLNEDDSEFIGPIKIKTPCQNFVAPWHYGVETQITNSDIGDCWTSSPEILYNNYFWTSSSFASSSVTGPSTANSGNNYFVTRANTSTVSNDANLLSPTIDISSLATPALNFFTFMYGQDIGSLHVDILHEGTWTEDIFVLNGQQQASNNDPWEEHFVDLSGYTNQIQIRFRASSNGNYNDHIAIDDISVIEKPDCIKPTNINFSTATTNSVDINWNNLNTDTSQYTIEYGLQGFSLGSGTQESLNTTHNTLTGLASNTSYDVYIRTECTNGNNSDWIGPFAFTTTPDYCNGDHFYDSGGPNNPYFNRENYTETIFPSTENGIVTVEFNSFELEGCCDSLSVYDGIDTNATLIGTYSGTNSPGTITATNTSGALTFRFTSDTSVVRSGWDATVICDSSTCPKPTNLMVNETLIDSATLSWDNVGTESNWIIEYGETGFTPEAGTEVTVEERNYILTNLNSQTTYDIYVKASCTDEISNAIKTSFTTTPDYCNGDRFYDSGGVNNNYTNGENYTKTIFPSADADRVSVTFTTFDLESCCDFLSVYDGSDTSAPLIGTYSGTDNPGTFTATNSEGSLTFAFISNDLGTSIGWEATVNCLYDCPIPLNPIVENITTNEATITWDTVDSEQSWDIIFAYDDIIRDYYTVNSNSFTFTNLDPSKTYQYGIRANCGNTSSFNNSSDWIGTFSFTTSCDNTTSAPFSENFSSLATPNCWIESGAGKWNYNTNAVYNDNLVSDNTNDTNYAWVDLNNNNATLNHNLKTIPIDISNLDAPTVKFSVFSLNDIDTNFNKLTVTLHDDSDNVVELIELDQETQGTWETFIFNLNDYKLSSDIIQISFNISGTSPNNYVLLDDIQVNEAEVLSNEDLFSLENFSYYPNPTHNKVFLKSDDILTKIEVYNLVGQKVINQKIIETRKINEVDLGNLPVGTYIIKFYASKKVKTFKVIKK